LCMVYELGLDFATLLPYKMPFYTWY
jgi:hypothetical protein